MKYFVIFALIITKCCIFFAHEPFQILLEPLWVNFVSDMNQEFGEQWILAGNITFKKKALETVHLDRIVLAWHGIPLEHLESSLYKKSLQDAFMPIDEYLICDGKWNKRQQWLTFKFNYQLHLNYTNTFYLVVTVPDELVEEFKKGSFELVPEFLPEQFKETKSAPLLCLANHESIKLATAHPPQKAPAK